MVCGYNMVANETFSSMAKLKSIKILLAVAAQRDHILEQADIKTAYLNGEIKQRVVVAPPEGIPSPLNGPSVWVLERAVYGMPDSLP